MMDTEIRILRELERDLELAAALEVRNAKREDHRPWKAWIGAAAAVLLVAWGIGWVATHGIGFSTSQSTSAAAAGEPGGRNPQPHEPPGGGLGTSSSSPAALASGQDLAKIARDGSLTLVIRNGTFDERFGAVVRITDRNGGFVLSQSTEGSDSGSFVLRIPAKRFDAAMGAIRGLGRTDSSQVTGKDVTQQYIDQQARLAILTARRASLLRLLDQATTLSASLTLSDRIDEVQLDIEQAQGELRFLDAQVAESTLHVDMHEADSTAAVSAEGGTGIRNPSLGRAVDRAVQGFLGVIATVLVGLGYLLPMAIIFGLGFAAWRVAQRRREPVV
jgi:hypothetical protein